MASLVRREKTGDEACFSVLALSDINKINTKSNKAT
jgi:hypothetical protein